MKPALLAAAAFGLLAAPADAALVAYNVKINGGATTKAGIVAPVSGLLVDFDVRYDDSVLIYDRTQEGLTINSSNFGWNHPLYYAWNPDPIYPVLTFGVDIEVNGYHLDPDADNIGLFISDIATAPRISGGDYSNSSGQIFGLDLSLAVTKLSTAAVPEPATWAMLLVGFGVIGYVLRRRSASVIPMPE